MTISEFCVGKIVSDIRFLRLQFPNDEFLTVVSEIHFNDGSKVTFGQSSKFNAVLQAYEELGFSEKLDLTE